MSGYDFRVILDNKCVPCCYFSSCKVRQGFLDLLRNDVKITYKVSDKVKNCLFFRQSK